nr:MAG TPA: hypothetical protein [Caudoviricetes sp.]
MYRCICGPFTLSAAPPFYSVGPGTLALSNPLPDFIFFDGILQKVLQ